MEPAERRRVGERLIGLVRAAGGKLTVGGDIDLAAALGADGVHLGGGRSASVAAARDRLGADAWVGVSAHGGGEVVQAAEAGADYATLSPIFATASKPGYGPALGPDALRAASRSGFPVLALGGIGPDTLPACREAGAAGVAVMGLPMRAPDPAAAVRRCLDAWRSPA